MLYDTLKALCRISGVSGAEAPVAAYIKKKLLPLWMIFPPMLWAT